MEGFNPRARVGRDLGAGRFWVIDIRFQSTRPRGARRAKTAQHYLAALFQSTRPRGARLIPELFDLTNDKFQSTRPRGARRGGTSSSTP